MSEVELTEQLDRAIEAILRDPKRAPEDADPAIADLIGIAVELCSLPRSEFQERLRKEIEMQTALAETKETMSTNDSQFPARIHTVIPYVVVSDVHEEVDFIEKVFAAQGKIYGLGSQGGFHSEYTIGDSKLMIGGGGKGSKWRGTPVPAVFHLYVQDVDETYRRAMESGAISLMAPADMEYGERSAGIEDIGGNHWYLATAFGPSYLPEGVRNLMPYFHPVGAPKMIEFLEQAFAADEVAVHRSPDGIVQHAKVSIGDSIVEMGEAHGRWQPRPMHFMVYVEDCDEAYARAMKAEGAISIGAPANAPYGGRTGTVQDPFGNTWYVSSQTAK